MVRGLVIHDNRQRTLIFPLGITCLVAILLSSFFFRTIAASAEKKAVDIITIEQSLQHLNERRFAELGTQLQ